MLPPVLLQDAAPSSQITESQIMSSLNSSIEDLLSKISQVQYEYEAGSQDLCQNASFSFKNSKKNRQKFHVKRSSSRCLTAASESNQSEKHLPSQYEQTRPFNQGQNSQAYLSQTSIENGNDKVQSKMPTLKNIRIQSLFDNSSVKELASSQIFSEEPNQTSQHLSLVTREVSQIIIENAQLTQASPVSQEGLSLSQFEVGHSVGSGKFGEVYLCRHKKTGFLFALKKIFKSTIKEYRMEDQFCLEIKLLYLMSHPNVVKLYGHFCDDYHIFLLMEYVQGGQLMTRINSQQKYVARVLEPLLEAVEYLHSCDIIHRDIKPENIVLAFDNTPKLCDFGWAAQCNRANMRQTFCGTLDYLSPEMKESGPYSFSVDLWSLGVLTYELLTGAAPFKEELMHWRKRGSSRSHSLDWSISYPPAISALAKSFMQNLLKENPDERSSLTFCRNHFFIRKYKIMSNEGNQISAELDI